MGIEDEEEREGFFDMVVLLDTDEVTFGSGWANLMDFNRFGLLREMTGEVLAYVSRGWVK